MPAPVSVSNSARSLLLTLLGEYVLQGDRPVWTANLLEVLTQLGVDEKTGRQAIARASAAGWINGVRDGRRVAWQITPRLRKSMVDGLQRVRSTGQKHKPWDGRWLVLSVSLPESHRAVRAKFYKALRWTGFGTPAPGLWINPHADRVEETQTILSRLQLSEFSRVFVGAFLQTGQELRQMIRAAWDHDEIYATYARLLKKFSGTHPQTPSEAFEIHFRLVHEWQQIPFIDPVLPKELLASDVRAQRAAQQLEKLRLGLGVSAHKYWRKIVSVPPPK